MLIWRGKGILVFLIAARHRNWESSPYIRKLARMSWSHPQKMPLDLRHGGARSLAACRRHHPACDNKLRLRSWMSGISAGTEAPVQSWRFVRST